MTTDIALKKELPLSEKTWFHVLMLVLFWPVGLYFLWRTKRYSKAVRFGPLYFLGGMVVLGLVGNLVKSATLGTRQYKFTITLSEDTRCVSSAGKVESIWREASKKTTEDASSSSAVRAMVNQGKNSYYGNQVTAMSIGAYVSDTQNHYTKQIFASESEIIPAGTTVDIIHLYAIYPDGHIESTDLEEDTSYALVANSETGKKLGVVEFAGISDIERSKK